MTRRCSKHVAPCLVAFATAWGWGCTARADESGDRIAASLRSGFDYASPSLASLDEVAGIYRFHSVLGVGFGVQRVHGSTSAFSDLEYYRFRETCSEWASSRGPHCVFPRWAFGPVAELRYPDTAPGGKFIGASLRAAPMLAVTDNTYLGHTTVDAVLACSASVDLRLWFVELGPMAGVNFVSRGAPVETVLGARLAVVVAP